MIGRIIKEIERFYYLGELQSMGGCYDLETSYYDKAWGMEAAAMMMVQDKDDLAKRIQRAKTRGREKAWDEKDKAV